MYIYIERERQVRADHLLHRDQAHAPRVRAVLRARRQRGAEGDTYCDIIYGNLLVAIIINSYQ